MMCWNIFIRFHHLSRVFHESVNMKIIFQNITTDTSLTFLEKSVNTSRHCILHIFVRDCHGTIPNYFRVEKPWTYFMRNLRCRLGGSGTLFICLSTYGRTFVQRLQSHTKSDHGCLLFSGPRTKEATGASGTITAKHWKTYA